MNKQNKQYQSVEEKLREFKDKKNWQLLPDILFVIATSTIAVFLLSLAGRL